MAINEKGESLGGVKNSVMHTPTGFCAHASEKVYMNLDALHLVDTRDPNHETRRNVSPFTSAV